MSVTNTIETRFAADVTSYVSGVNKANKSLASFIQNNRSLGQATQNAVKSLAAMNPAAALAASGLAALGAAAISSAKQAIALADSLLVVSDRTGLTVESLSGLKFAAEQSNASFADVQTGLRFLARTAAAAANGNDKAAASFKRIGVSIKDANGNLKTADQLFSDVAEGVKNIQDPMQKTAAAAELLGRQSGPALVPLLNQGREGIAALRKEAEGLGLIISTGFAKQADEFGDNMNKLKSVSTGFGVAIADALLPALNDFLGELIRTAPKALEDFRVGLLTANFLLQKFSAFNSIAIQSVIGLKAAISGNKAAFADSNAKMAFFIEQLTQTQEEFLEGVAAAEKHTKAVKGVGEGAAVAATAIKGLVVELEAARELSQSFTDLTENIRPLSFGRQQEGERTAERGQQFLAQPAEPRELAEETLRFQDQIAAAILAQDLAAQQLNGTLEEGVGILQGLTNFSFAFGDALFDAAMGAKGAFGEFFKQLLKDLLRAIIRATILQAILGIFSGGGLSLAKIGASIQKQLGFGGFQDKESSILGRASQASGISAGLAGPSLAAAPAAGANSSLTVQIHEPGPLTWSEITDRKVLPRLRERQRRLNEQPL
jgi:hypothetical protein